MSKYIFNDLVIKKKGLLRGPFGGALKKEIFVPKSEKTYKVYEQGPVLNHDWRIGHYYISEDYFNSDMKGFECKPGDFLVSCSGVNYGAIYRLPEGCERGIINQALLRIRVDESVIDPQYFYYLFKVLISKIITTGGGDSTIPNFPSLDTIKAIPVELPSLPEQKKIGEFLNRIDTLIDNNTVIYNKISSYLDKLFDKWFLGYHFPTSNGKTYITNNGKLVHNDLIDADIPENWQVFSINKTPYSKTIKPGIDVFSGEKIYLSTACVDGRFITNDKVMCSYDNRESRANMEPIANSVWFAKMKNTVKTLSFSNNSKLLGKYILSTGFEGIQCEPFFFNYYRTLIEKEWFEISKDYKASGSTQEAVSDETLSYIKIVVPPKDVLLEFDNITKDYVRKREVAFETNVYLNNYLEFVMTRMIDGSIVLKR